MGSRSVDELVAHVVWAVKDRRPLLREADDSRLVALFGAKAVDAGAIMLAAGCSADHVHVLLQFAASRPLSDVVQRLKGASSRAHNLEDPASGFAWQDGFWARSCDPRDLDAILAYILGQREHHRSERNEDWDLREVEK